MGHMLNTILSNCASTETFEAIIYSETQADPNIGTIHPKTSTPGNMCQNRLRSTIPGPVTSKQKKGKLGHVSQYEDDVHRKLWMKLTSQVFWITGILMFLCSFSSIYCFIILSNSILESKINIIPTVKSKTCCRTKPFNTWVSKLVYEYSQCHPYIVYSSSDAEAKQHRHHKEAKFIVYKRCLWKLLTYCPHCGDYCDVTIRDQSLLSSNTIYVA